ncbi:High potential iron-sulfur protein [Luteibacter pinisoli]|uniref:High-potential iron-sulfur protein n=1 Tax=Luteibacter pinisoli TaxID=2589080 RepID=A0A4Y5Z4Y7_9GAMM|nr:high-potential iron-sulfur protein [Luteibacter pinisoli]QDE39595.1 High potential iron-sulfur protein [Luteibacter pinisoli]
MAENDTHNIEGRRRFLKAAAGSVAAATVLGTLPRRAQAQDLPHLSPSDPTASALKYVEDGSKAQGKKTASDACFNCNFYQGKAGAAWGPCQLFPGKAVAAKGWCVSHAVMI